MQVRELIDKLKQFESDTEVCIYYWDENLKQSRMEDFSIEQYRYGRMFKEGGICFVTNQPAYEKQECMVGGHDDGCMCNLGFTPRWRNMNG